MSSVCQNIVKAFGYVWIAHVTINTIKTLVSVARTSITSVFSNSNTNDNGNSQTEVIFFPDQSLTCKLYLEEKVCKNENCKFSHEETSLSRLTKHLSSARKRLDVCVFTITSQHLADILIAKQKKGVIVRIITDCEKMNLNCSQIEQFRANGIQVRHDNTSYFMHHKFAIVDKQTLINGSFNWTVQAITGNQENVIISDMQNLVQPYVQEFERLWQLYQPMF